MKSLEDEISFLKMKNRDADIENFKQLIESLQGITNQKESFLVELLKV